MKILLRTCGDEQYVWKKAEAKSQNTFVLEDGREIAQTNVVSIARDNRKRFVICAECGAIIKNTKEAIEEHKAKGSTSATCFGCRYMNERNKKQLSAKYTLQDDGSYAVTTKSSTKLICSMNYYIKPDINSPDAREYCKYKKCATAAMNKIEDIFTKYPGIFDDIITVDKVLDNGFTDRREIVTHSLVYYTLKARNTIEARVNKMNIVDSFVVHYRGNSWVVVYSKKYDKLYRMDNAIYQTFNPYQIPAKTIENIKAKIASLYN